ncbi:MAG: P-loop NTPase [Brevinema sp.]
MNIQQKIQDIFNKTIEPRSQKKLAEIVKIHGFSENSGLIKVQLVVDVADSEEKTELRKFIENTLSKEEIEALVSMISTEHLTPKVKPSQVHEFIPTNILNKFKKIIAVYSTKGGVGKSTISAELALELAKKGLKTALIDLDIYGPSIPRILGVRGKVVVANDKFQPFSINGIDMISVGSLIPDIDSALIWRAPIVNGVIKQLFVDVAWADDYDVLVLDMPPGTGDIPIAVGQSIPVNAVVAVSTPNGIALEDTVKGISMFQKFHRDILGLVYNMGSVVCEDCQKTIPISKYSPEFDSILKKYNIRKIADLPLDANVSDLSDQGKLDQLKPSSLWKKEFQKITDLVYQKICF